LPDVLGDLADIWLIAPDRQAVTDAQARIDELLSQDPVRHGQHLSEGLYRLRVPPLTITYTVDPDRREVEVTSVRTT
jgi:mRNA-degrading endonuclease RelE of RelBE toxin-antitoxin system